MWVFLNDAFLSIVDEKAKMGKRRGNKANDADVLVVRARRQGDIERVFSAPMHSAKRKLEVLENEVTDYRYRALIPRSIVRAAMADEVDRVTYGNFKDSVGDDTLHTAYSRVWGVMYQLQKQPKPYSLFDEGVPV